MRLGVWSCLLVFSLTLRTTLRSTIVGLEMPSGILPRLGIAKYVSVFLGLELPSGLSLAFLTIGIWLIGGTLDTTNDPLVA